MHIRHGDLCELERARSDGGAPWMGQACLMLRSIPDDPHGRVLVAEEGSSVRAVLGLELQWAGGGRLDGVRIQVLVVDPEHEHRGIGSRLVRFAEGIARIHGCSRVEVAPGLERWGHGRCWPGLGYSGRGNGLSKVLGNAARRAVER